METEMANLHVRNVDDEIVARLKERAAKHGRSAEAEHREILRRALEWYPAPTVDREDWKRRAAEFRENLKGRQHTPSETLLRESRDER
jgi:plasmid stability protein